MKPRPTLRRRLVTFVAVVGLGFAAAAAAGLRLGGWDFLRQHAGALAGAAAFVIALGVLGYGVAAGIGRGLMGLVRRPRRLGEEGAVAAEFVIVVIPFLLMLFGLMQMALASLARVLVSYSAFCAARAAIVIVPMPPEKVQEFGAKMEQAVDNELANRVGYGADVRTDFAISQKAALIRNAAAYPLIPASPSIDVVVTDTMQNWGPYLTNRLVHGLDPTQYLASLLGDLAAYPAAIIDGLAGQLKSAIQGGLDTPQQKAQAKQKINDWIDKTVSDPQRREQLKGAAGGYIDKYTGSKESPTGQVGEWVKGQINDTLKGPLEKFRDQVQGALAGAMSGLGGNGPAGGFKGSSVDRALDTGFGAGTDGAAGAILRSLRKLVYARMGTVVTLHDANGNLKTRFAWNEPIRARVTHLFYCQIPLANRFAGSPFYNLPNQVVGDLATGPMKGLTILGIPGYFLPLTAEHTLVNQGKP